MFTRMAKRISKGLSYPAGFLGVVAMCTMVFCVLAVVANVLGRWLFKSPILGTAELTKLGFSIMVWGMVAVAAFKVSHTALTFLVDRFPRLPNLILRLIVSLASGGTMGLICWRLVVYGIDEWEKLSQTNVLRLPYAPFEFIGAFACAVTALIFLARVPDTVGKMRKEQD